MKNIIRILVLTMILSSTVMMSCDKEIQETTPTMREVSETVFASGELTASGMYALTAESSGYITDLHIEEGDLIQKGQKLLTIKDRDNQINLNGAIQQLDIAKSRAEKNTPLLTQAKSNITIAKDQLEHDSLNLARMERLWQKNTVAKVDYENALLQYEMAHQNVLIAKDNYRKLQDDANQAIVDRRVAKELYESAISKHVTTAIKGGKVYHKYKSIGDYVKQGELIAEIADPEHIYAEVKVDESNIAKIRIGQSATVQLNVHQDRVYQAEVAEILPSFDESSQSFICKLYFIEPLDFRIINTQLQSNILISEAEQVMLIPRNYIDYGGYVQIKGQEEKTKVETKFISSEWVQVISGIDENTVLITDNIITSKS